VIDLTDRRTGQAVVDAARRIARRELERGTPVMRIGVVAGDPVMQTRKVDVRLAGQDEISPGFTFGSIIPRDGDLVRVVIDPRGDRFVDDVLGRDAASFVPVVTALPESGEAQYGRLVILAGDTGVADAVYVCRRDDTGAYIWVVL